MATQSEGTLIPDFVAYYEETKFSISDAAKRKYNAKRTKLQVVTGKVVDKFHALQKMVLRKH